MARAYGFSQRSIALCKSMPKPAWQSHQTRWPARTRKMGFSAQRGVRQASQAIHLRKNLKQQSRQPCCPSTQKLAKFSPWLGAETIKNPSLTALSKLFDHRGQLSSQSFSHWH